MNGTSVTTGIPLPAPVQEFVDATNPGDSAVFLEAFTDDPALDDWGRVFVGRDGVATWNHRHSPQARVPGENAVTLTGRRSTPTHHPHRVLLPSDRGKRGG